MADQQQGNEQHQGNPDHEQGPSFQLQRLYTPDLSFEAPKSPEIFRKNWAPQVSLELNTRQKQLQENFYEVVLTLQVTVKVEEEVAFIAEVHQAGVFLIQGLDGPNLSHTLGAFCPNMLFPYARETLDSLVVRGSFPALMLAPINFEALYARRLQEMQQEGQPANQEPLQ